MYKNAHLQNITLVSKLGMDGRRGRTEADQGAGRRSVICGSSNGDGLNYVGSQEIWTESRPSLQGSHPLTLTPNWLLQTSKYKTLEVKDTSSVIVRSSNRLWCSQQESRDQQIRFDHWPGFVEKTGQVLCVPVPQHTVLVSTDNYC